MDKLISILTELHPDIDFSSATDLVDTGILDSFDVVSIVAEVNDAFGIAITAEYLIPENFNSASAMYAMIQQISD